MRTWNLESGIWNLPRLRRGASIIEVLFAILVASVGLLGAVAIFPVASAQARRGRVNDAIAVAGRTAVHVFDAMGMRRPDRWMAWYPGPAPPSPGFYAFPPHTVRPGESYCIDARFIAVQTGTTGAQTFPYQEPFQDNPANPSGTAGVYDPGEGFTGNQDLNGNGKHDPGFGPPFSPDAQHRAPLMRRLTLRRSPGEAFPMSKLQADAIFSLDDDLAFDRPVDRSIPGQQLFDVLPNDVSVFSKRQNEGHFSWMATLVPHMDMYSGAPTDEYVLSIIMFHDRPAELSGPANITEHDPVSRATNERVLNVFVDGDGASGGEVVLYWPTTNSTTPDAAASMLKVRPNDWIMLSGTHPRLIQGAFPPGANPNPFLGGHFQWYRVTNCDTEPTLEPATTVGSVTLPERYQIYATLMGQDWNVSFTNQRATIVAGVAGVYEKTVRLDYGSDF